MKIVAVEKQFCKAHQFVDDMIEFVNEATKKGLRLDQVERELFRSLLEVGRELTTAFIKQAGDGDEGQQVQHDEQILKRSESKKARPYRSIFGVIEIERYVYASREKQKAEYLPVDERLGLPKGEHSYVLEDWLQRFCVQRAFSNSVESLADLLGCSVSMRAAERMNRDMSEYVEPFRMEPQAAASPEEENEILVVSADGKGVPMRRPLEERVSDAALPAWLRHYRKQQTARNVERTDKRLGKGQKPGQKQMAYVGTVYSIAPWQRTAEDVIDDLCRRKRAESRPRPKNKRVWAEMTQFHEEEVCDGQPRLFAGLAYEVYQRDRERQRPLVCLMDGQRSLWCMKDEWLPRAIPILDIFHTMERLWNAAYCFHKDGSLEAEEFVTHHLRMLLEGKVGYVIGGFRRRLGELQGPKRTELSKVIQFFDNNRQSMQYDMYLAKGYPIGSGVVEGACRHLVRDRMECTGMHWELPGAQAMLNTRSVYLSGDWDDFIEYRIQKEQAVLYGRAA